MNREKESVPENNSKDRTAMFDSLRKELKRKAHWMLDWQSKDTKSSLVSRWELGEALLEVDEDHRSNGSKLFGTKAFETLAKVLGESVEFLRVSLRLANQWNSEDIKTICGMQMKDGHTPLSFSHIRTLMTIDEKDERVKLIDLTLENSWNSAELGKYIHEHYGNSGNNTFGRAGKPKTVDQVIQQQLDFAADFNARNTKIWKEPTTSLSAQLAKLAPLEYTEQLVNQLSALSTGMWKVVEEAKARAEEADRKRTEVLAVLRAHDEGIKTVAELGDQANDELDEDAENDNRRRGQRPVSRRRAPVKP